MARDISIDPATGLPELPPERFFRVGRHTIEVIAERPAGEWIHESLFTDYHHPNERVTRQATITQKKRIPFLPWVKRDVEKVVEHTCLRRKAGEVEVTRFSQHKGGERHVRGEGVGPGGMTVITPANLLGFAWVVAHEAWDIHESRGIVGDYPPKRFEATA